MRIIDLLKDIVNVDLSNTPNKGNVIILELCFECLDSKEFKNFIDLSGEHKILRIVSKNSRGFYSIGIGTNKLKGWYLSPSKSHISIDLQDFADINQDDSYLVLKYGKTLLEEI